MFIPCRLPIKIAVAVSRRELDSDEIESLALIVSNSKFGAEPPERLKL